MSNPTVLQRAYLGLQYVLPHHLLSNLIYRATRWRFKPWKNLLIRTVIARFGVNMDEAQSGDLDAYPSMNAFFTRALKPGVRPIDATPMGMACPADGAISQAAAISDGRIIQAKGRDYSVAELLAEDPSAEAFRDGTFTTIYLSPKDYHRIHMPIAGELKKSIYVPGRLFSVAPLTTDHIPKLFARNERLVCLFETEFGPLAVILVGAMLVSSIETVWDGECGTLPEVHHSRPQEPLRLEKGAEMGRFNMGSTVILLMGDPAWQWAEHVTPGADVQMGERLATLSRS